MGFLVDRVGALPVVVTGLIALCSAIIGIGLVHDPAMLGLLAIAGGAANGVFHPANYVIMAKAIQPSRLGRSFAVHTFAGHIGNALAPVTIIFLAVSFDWRVALMTTGALGIAACIFGDPHLTSFDGVRFDFQGAGEYHFARSTQSVTPPPAACRETESFSSGGSGAAGA